MNEPSILSVFLGKKVTVQVDDRLAVEGRLTAYRNSSRNTHEPSVLVLDGKRILRGNFQSIKKNVGD
jgi:hypothetical protein